MALAPGLVSFVRIVVAATDTALAMGSGDVPVLATPRLLALAEAAAVAAIRPSLESSLTSVGTSVVMEHKRPSPVGAEIVVEAELTEVHGRRLVFSFIGGTSGSLDQQMTKARSSAQARWSGCSWTGTGSSAEPSTSDQGGAPRHARSAAEAGVLSVCLVRWWPPGVSAEGDGMPGYFRQMSMSQTGGGEQCPQCGESDLRPYGNGSKWACPRCYFIVPCCEGRRAGPVAACSPAAGTGRPSSR